MPLPFSRVCLSNGYFLLSDFNVFYELITFKSRLEYIYKFCSAHYKAPPSSVACLSKLACSWALLAVDSLAQLTILATDCVMAWG